MAENFIRSLGLMVSDLQRQEFTTLTWASEFLIQELVELLFIDAGIPRRTVKRIRSDLPTESSRILDAIPRAKTTRDSIVRSQLATTAVHFPLARWLIEAAGGIWPTSLEEATRVHIRDGTGVPLPLSTY